MKLLIFVLIYFMHVGDGKLKISTYNIWNIMFGWEMRKYRIARMVKEIDADIIGLQEVRFNSLNDNQVNHLQQLLPKYKWKYVRPANNITIRDDSITNTWIREGIGLISKIPILSASVFHLPYVYGPDTNKRIGLHAQLETDSGKVINVIVVHLSYDRQQQCSNAAAVLNFIHYKKLTHTVILGDFNTYKDFDMPVQLLTHTSRMSLGKCSSQLESYMKKTSAFQDAWKVVHALDGDNGYTFSNMPYPGLESRPDRILVSSNLRPVSAELTGDGRFYKDLYSGSIMYHRFRTVIQSAFLSYRGIAGYSCLQDCGPNGSCRCGVCVKGGNQNNCQLPDCVECNSHIYKLYVAFIMISLTLLIHLFYAVVIILVTGSDYRREELFNILGCNCCLCNKNLYRKGTSRKHKLLKLLQRWPLFRLPPYLLLVLTLIMLLVTYFYGKSVFADTFKTVYSVMEEEYFPSDHLMLTVGINI
ncbi:hypothetical protein FSP39_006160 [Pinctada imbricata]|uniref:Endonuclease/exonuclease/phosphatase domain-containing protein n=1 Tax=Pinctada imbricata TaxID=66713 RepID=A0AA89C0W2_PINIB|nr:hypothetical protein FSP39_006160 [Pinctada imbricata]